MTSCVDYRVCNLHLKQIFSPPRKSLVRGFSKDNKLEKKITNYIFIITNFLDYLQHYMYIQGGTKISNNSCNFFHRAVIQFHHY